MRISKKKTGMKCTKFSCLKNDKSVKSRFLPYYDGDVLSSLLTLVDRLALSISDGRIQSGARVSQYLLNHVGS